MREGRCRNERTSSPAQSAVSADTFILSFEPELGHPIRIAGTRVCALFGREIKGEAFLDLFSRDARDEMRHLIAIVAHECVGVRPESASTRPPPAGAPRSPRPWPARRRPRRTRSQQDLGDELGPSLRAAFLEADERVADQHVAIEPVDAEDLRERNRLLLRILGPQVELAEAELVASWRAARRSSRAAGGSRAGSPPRWR